LKGPATSGAAPETLGEEKRERGESGSTVIPDNVVEEHSPAKADVEQAAEDIPS